MSDLWQQDSPNSPMHAGSPMRSGSVEPDILPPAGQTSNRTQNHGWYPPPEQQYSPPQSRQPRSRPPGWAFAPATYVLVGINCAVYLGMVLTGASFWDPTIEKLLIWGANNGTLVLHYGQWWRLITAMFVHAGIIHIAANMWCLWNLGLLAEPLMGPFGVVACYLLTGFAGNLLSVMRYPGVAGHPSIVGVGASGAVFGIAGALILLLNSPLLPLPRAELKRLRKSVIYFSVINLAIGLYTAVGPSPIKIDNMAHLGGFLSGLLLGALMIPRIGAAKLRFERRRFWSVIGMTFGLLLVTFWVHSFWMTAALPKIK
ncbi:MAG TPA: rhomboid family intramembrane serine protease [Acidobacteriaceae bacterium]|nr:rhomboid family intramembrane serine protease [Acidobacteriaceae bacterium]